MFSQSRQTSPSVAIQACFLLFHCPQCLADRRKPKGQGATFNLKTFPLKSQVLASREAGKLHFPVTPGFCYEEQGENGCCCGDPVSSLSFPQTTFLGSQGPNACLSYIPAQATALVVPTGQQEAGGCTCSSSCV